MKFQSEYKKSLRNHKMERCAFCKKKSATASMCESCGRTMCVSHIVPEAHKCLGLEQLRDSMRKEHERILMESASIIEKKQAFNLDAD